MANHDDPAQSDSLNQWKEKVYLPQTEATPERKEEFLTSSGIPIDPLYVHREDSGVADSDQPDPGLPGVAPFTRGIHATMFRSRFWTMRQYAGFSSARETNLRFRELLSQGQMGLSVAFDLPTQIGYDPDHGMSEGEVGKVGVSIATLDDLDLLLDGIPLDRVSISMTINSTASILLALLVALARRRGVSPSSLRGTVQNDILKEYAARGTYRFPEVPSMRLITDVFGFASEHLPRFNPISVSGYHIREAGATAVQEVAFTLANAVSYLDAAKAAGLEVEKIARRLSFFFNAHNHFFEEVAKFRAARRLWANLLVERFDVTDEKARALRFHTQTAGSTLTSQQSDVNVVRVTMQALAAVLGGTQSLHTNSRDEALSLPTREAATLALRTQQVIAHESGVTDCVDPLGGCPYVETLTDQVEAEARKLMEKVSDLGGSVEAIRTGFMQREIHASAYRQQKAIETEDMIVVGVNKFVMEEDHPPHDRTRIAASLQQERAEELAAHRKKRDDGKVKAARTALVGAAKGTENLMPLIVDSVEVGVTLGEICSDLESVFGEHREKVVF